ncbi:DNA-binding response regulator, LytR/AlgR family [Algoriphagus locisalis]|uniref:DNA-binding response regulator, LytR/AlgR family n=1 Tax=Algoriphagus locisalis TaxID=305507 RepID=A0A1I7E830_9BACT|nr:LytTR family DNA-binding domain-containing protein [Algoriphagus locisalis]SFU20090.1 DNA-binding response regulator, LytR/AlgR family [Algoriphagus locisalis]
MKVILIEDELPAIEKLSHFLQKYNPNSQILGVASSIAQAVPLLGKYGEEADLLLVDVQLEDGLSFQALDQVSFFKPVIFITAHSQYALEAFQANGIDYLVKPIRYSAFEAALDKFRQLSGNALNQSQNTQLWQYFKKPSYKERFMVKIGEHIHSIATSSIHLFNTEGRNTYLILEDGKRFITDYKMESLEEIVDPALFFRVNRSFMVHLSAIKDVLVYSNSRLKINPTIPFKEEIIVSRDRVSRFKEWLGGTGET